MLKEKNGNSQARLLLVMVLVGLALRLAVIPFVYAEHLDSAVIAHREFGRVAKSIALGQGFSNALADTGPSALMPPVYSLVLGTIFKLFGIHTKTSILVALGLNSLFSALTCIPVFLISRRSFGSRAALWAGWGWVFSPYGIYYGAECLWSACLTGLLLSLLFLVTLHLQESTRIRSWFGYGLLWGFAALTEPMMLAVLPLLGGWACHRLHRRGRNWLYPAAVASLLLVACVSPWFIRNYRTFHQFIPFRDGFGMELYTGNSGDSSYWVTKYLHPNHSDAEMQEYIRVGEIRYMAHKRQQAVAFISRHPGWFAWMSLRRAVYTWTGYWSFDHDYLQQEPLDPPNVFLRTTLTILALWGLLRAFRRDAASAFPYAAVLFCFPFLYYFTHSNPEFIYPLDPLILVLVTYRLFGQPRVSKEPSRAADKTLLQPAI